GCLQTFEAGNPLAQSPAYVLPPADMVVGLAQLLDADCGAELAQPIVESDHVGEIEVGLCCDDALGVVPDQLQASRQRIVVGDTDTAFAGVNVLMVVEAENADVTDRAGVAAMLGRQGTLRVV